MMTNSLSLAEQNSTFANSVKVVNTASRAIGNGAAAFDLVGWLASLRVIVALSAIVSGIMEENITPRFTLHLINVQLAGCVALFPADVDVCLRVICILWFATSLCLAKRAYNAA